MWQKVKNYYHLLSAFLAVLFFNFPSKKLIVIGVTGTDGKTTTVHMIYHILKSAGRKVSMVSSVRVQIGQKLLDTGLHVTTPSPWQVQKLLKTACDAGSNYFVMEATSHGLDQNRLAFVNFDTAVVTNITHDHLDYHKNWQNYATAKARLFKEVRSSVLNMDDDSFNFLKKRIGGKVIGYSTKLAGADFNLKNFPIKLKIAGDYNLANAMAAAAVLTNLKIDKTVIIGALNSFEGVRGRMEDVDLGQDFRAIIDFAHTPNALNQALSALRQTANGKHKIIAVFGSAGERDKSKRPLMGKIASEKADIIILCAEDPRSEIAVDICQQIAKGIKNKKEGHDYFIIPDRREAIEFACKLAKAGDVAAVFGKGHEKSMCFGKKEVPWDEFEVVKEAILSSR